MFTLICTSWIIFTLYRNKHFQSFSTLSVFRTERAWSFILVLFPLIITDLESWSELKVCKSFGSGRSGTGWPVKHGSVFLVPCKKWLVRCTRVEISVHWTRTFLTGYPVYKIKSWILIIFRALEHSFDKRKDRHGELKHLILKQT